MIVGMKYNQDGSRYISNIAMGSEWTPTSELARAYHFLNECDEVYIINFDRNYLELINEIVVNGCRIGV